MSFPALEQYLARLHHLQDNAAHTLNSVGEDHGSRVWLDAAGRAQGRYFNATLTSVFQPIRKISVTGESAVSNHAIVAYEGFAHSYSATDNGLYLSKLLDKAASDDESIELDRLCRMLHAINFYRQANAFALPHADLYLSIHERLLAGVDSNHGMAFRRILKLLDLPHERIVLQLPSIAPSQDSYLNYVIDNYRRNHFRLAVQASSISEAYSLLERVRPDVLKLSNRNLSSSENDAQILRLLKLTQERNIQLVFTRIEKQHDVDHLQRVGRKALQETGAQLVGQGYFWDLPQAALHAFSATPNTASSEELAIDVNEVNNAPPHKVA
ncbi:EAL domain-containing protein [Glaciimonas soli]|uniref:EAL domain-containing protein n=1 Tax=Glaciimonas soli TaxID=2590999 RepID=A0A843YPV6_9BURK|nr:EAL domain-containing protein [Glaciimonas soli]MQQ99572.1 EAL domain-containing protein [Glaciimonas soli]